MLLEYFDMYYYYEVRVCDGVVCYYLGCNGFVW